MSVLVSLKKLLNLNEGLKFKYPAQSQKKNYTLSNNLYYFKNEAEQRII